MSGERLGPLTLALVAFSVTMTVSGQLTLRAAMDGFGDAALGEIALLALTTPLVWAGALMYLLSASSSLVVLSRLDLSLAYPLGAMNYVLVVLASAVILDEQVPPMRWVGIGVILLGILVVARSDGARHEGEPS